MSGSRTSSQAVLVRERDLGDHSAPGPRRLPDGPGRLIRWAGPLLLPFSSAMRVVTEERVLALTYDDGPHPAHTREILDELAARDVRATFFVLTDRAEESPGLIRQILDAGHEIGLHGIDHARLTEVSALRAARTIVTAKRRLERVTGARVTMYRPTYGAQGLAQFLAARLLGMDVVYWTAWAQDWLDDRADEVVRRAHLASHPGAVLLLHDTTEDTDESLRPRFSRGEVTGRLLDALGSDGYRVVPVGQLLAGHQQVRAVTTQRPWSRLRHRLTSRARP